MYGQLEIVALYVGEILMGYRYSSTLVRSLEWDIRKKYQKSLNSAAVIRIASFRCSCYVHVLR